jgi:hypothetical protein
MQGLRKMSRLTGWAVVVAPALLLAASQADLVIPAGTRIDVRLISTLSSSANRSGDPFAAKVEDPIFSGGEEVIPAGSTLQGHVTFIKPAGRVHGKGEMRLVGDSIVTPGGQAFDFKAQVTNSQSSSAKVKGDEGTLQGPGKSAKQTAKDAGVGAAIGAGGGMLADGGTGALYGAGAGALVGLISNLVRHHKGVVLPVGTDLTFVFTSPAIASKAAPSKNPPATFICAGCR